MRRRPPGGVKRPRTPERPSYGDTPLPELYAQDAVPADDTDALLTIYMVVRLLCQRRFDHRGAPEPIPDPVATVATTTTTPAPKLSNVSAPCSERLGTFMGRVLRGFPSRLPELWEFRRRRFLRAAVVGGLPQLGVERMQVNCNLSSAHTTWDVKLRAQLDGICNLGITGLPRMYLRFTGPVVAKARFAAPLSDDSKPTLEDLQILSADVQEIHYQSVLGFEQPFVERASKYLLQRALREEVLGPLREAIKAEIENPSPEPPTTTDDIDLP
ncbi:hypothetical protein HPB51_020253 [Rhipicephalus microplus]|uniref:Uncharacterized protein n=1 Tax=Rhipicephalus microplus TaxID=6941 RepID=A0A9J6EUQ8_RHIMP|nr:hypothetical protein HPB51_020253 [Rhipicephalus microplus]